MIFYALSYLGVSYRYGGQNPEKEFDCSGLVRWVFNRSWGIMLPRRSVEIAQQGKVISRDEIQPGDLVFFNTLKRAYSHVGIYLGDGRFLHSPRAGGRVRIDDINLPYWRQRWDGARRLDSSASADSPGQSYVR
jgi:cell wall-associated NlpC family hydrolase